MEPRVAAILAIVSIIAATVTVRSVANAEPIHESYGQPFIMPASVESRSISFENPTGAKGAAGQAASNIGVGRKGSPCRTIAPGATVTLCDIQGTGIIRHIWVGTHSFPVNLRSLVVRAYWDDQSHPSIECPLGDFMGLAHGKVSSYGSAIHTVGQRGALNIWIPMPFLKHARLTITNEGKKDALFYFQLNYTINDTLPADCGRLHVLFRRENPTQLTKDFEILPKRTGTGRFVGCVLGIRSLDTTHWWGEGEFKVYLDGDDKFPTICGTGSEDYVGLSWEVQQTPFFYNGCNLNEGGYVSMYRWHLCDPIYWKKDCRITIQQIGFGKGLYERQDDWSTATFWYEPIPSEPLPPMPDVAARTANITVGPSSKP